jgi:hypothetical protein
MSTKRAMIHVLLRSEQSAGVVSMIESGSLPDFGGPPLHHHDFDETYYVMEGELTFQLGDELFSAKAGELTFAPGRRAARVGAAADPRGHHRRSADRRAGPRGSTKRPEGATFMTESCREHPPTPDSEVRATAPGVEGR